MKLFGHPIHIMLIHFPSALLPMEFVCSAIGYYAHITAFSFAAFYALCGGIVLGWLTIITGLSDLLQVYEEKPGAIQKVLWHGGINFIVILIYTILAYLNYKNYPALKPDGVAILASKAGLIAFMMAGNYLGGNLILKHKIAVANE